MISDVFSDAVAALDVYLNNKHFDKIYSGELRERILKIRADMDNMRIELDTPPPLGQLCSDNSVAFMYPDPSAIVPWPEFQFTVMANEDQLISHGYNSKYYWEPAMTEQGARWPNRVCTRFETVEKATALYEELCSKKLVALKNWVS